jgi:hypothetical protein
MTSFAINFLIFRTFKKQIIISNAIEQCLHQNNDYEKLCNVIVQLLSQ